MNTQWMMKLTLLAAMCGLLSCNKVNFSQVAEETQQAAELPPIIKDPGPVDPPVIPPVEPPVTPVAKLSAGDCADDSSTQLLSCVKCNVPVNPPPPPQYSAKGRSLLDGLAMACSVRNGSDPSGYVPPTRAQLEARLNRASPTLYPDSAMTAQQLSVINGLTDPNNDSMRKRLFGGLFYQPPYSDAFETYFGLTIAEARYTFCYDNPGAVFTMNNTSPIHSKAWYDCMYGNGSGSCGETTAYANANTFRSQLRSTMRTSISSPYVPPAPVPTKKCKWEKYEGEYDDVAQAKTREWLNKGYTLGMTIDTLAGRCESVTGVDSTLRGKVVISGYRCQ